MEVNRYVIEPSVTQPASQPNLRKQVVLLSDVIRPLIRSHASCITDRM
jgi:hypothetical protein